MARIGYGKIGRSMPLTLEKCGFVGGDNEPLTVLIELARRHPEHTFYIIGRNTGEDPTSVGLPPNVVNPWRDGWAADIKTFMKRRLITGDLSIVEQEELLDWHHAVTIPFIRDLDHIVLWLGQHGSSNTPIPLVDGVGYTKPQDAFAHYAGYLLVGVNAWRDVDPMVREEVWLNADPRNYHKMRDLKWPMRHPVLAQFNDSRTVKHERYGADDWVDPWLNSYAQRDEKNPKLWASHVSSVYARLEVCGVLDGTPVGDMLTFDDEWDRPFKLGLFINEARSYVKEELSRFQVMKRWVKPLGPDWVHGVWSKESMNRLQLNITPARFETFNDRYHATRVTFTTPSSGSGWATTKPWEAFACGTVCFFHPAYDSQNHILKDAPPILRFLRTPSPADLAERVARVDADPVLWRELVHAQREHYISACHERRYLRMIEGRLT